LFASIGFEKHCPSTPATDILDAMTEDLLRSLLSRRESTDLDFKRAFHSDDVELTKDIMAMANILAVGATGHIVFGVDEDVTGTGVPVGVSASDIPDDADLRQKMKDKLNKLPTFTYSTHPYDGLLLGLITITGDRQRPFFPIRAKGTLQRFVPMLRRGTMTDVASPDEVINWFQNDHSAEEEHRRLALDNMRAERAPRIRIVGEGRWQSLGHKIAREFRIVNEGLCAVRISRVVFGWRPSDTYIAAVQRRVTGTVEMLTHEHIRRVELSNAIMLQKGEDTKLTVQMNHAYFENGLRDFGLVVFPLEATFIDAFLEVEIESLPYGERNTEKIIFSFT
jgi:hypothetical protein